MIKNLFERGEYSLPFFYLLEIMRTFLLVFIVILLHGCICKHCSYEMHIITRMKVLDDSRKKPLVSVITNKGKYEIYGKIYYYVSKGDNIDLLYKNGLPMYIITPCNHRYVILNNFNN